MTSEETIALAEEEAAGLAVQAAPEDLLVGAVDRECGPAVLATCSPTSWSPAT